MERENDIFFEEWAFLARVDPEAFERRRRKVIDEFLSNSGRHRPGAEILQRRIDALRGRSKDPRECLLAISRLMHDQLVCLGDELNSLKNGLGKLQEKNTTHCSGLLQH
jgi:hypothetical protein